MADQPDARIPPGASTLTVATHSTTNRSTVRSNPRTIVTAPPWARDEPPSPEDEEPRTESHLRVSTSSRTPRTSDALSDDPLRAGPSAHSRWWDFARPRPDGAPSHPLSPPQQHPPSPPSPHEPARTDRRVLGLRGRSMTWLTSARRGHTTGGPRASEKLPDGDLRHVGGARNRSHLHIDLPDPTPHDAFTMAYNRTPGWEAPWEPATPMPVHSAQPSAAFTELTGGDRELTYWQRRKRRLRTLVLNNNYFPLLFRFINIGFITAAMAVAIRIRIIERRAAILGALGSSPTLVIIFSPMVLLYIFIAIYLEYFGRPLGLWNTSAKLAHTLSEIVFVAAWSAALSLCFDNFFTSVLRCASPSDTSWYSTLPRPSPPSDLAVSTADSLCDHQVSLIVIVAIALLITGTNLIISLYRIFEKIKYHPGGMGTNA